MVSKLPQTEKLPSEPGSKTIENKSGRLSKADKALIDSIILNGGTVEDAAREVRKNTKIVEDYVLINKSGITAEQLSIIEDLRDKPHYKTLRQELSPSELAQFEYEYARLLPQFNDDGLTASEEQQIFNMIKLQITIHRNEVARNRTQLALAGFYTRLDEEMAKDDQDKTTLLNIKTLLDGEANTNQKLLDNYNMLLQRLDQMQKSLKSTREQRKKNIEDRKVDFVDILRSLRDKDSRERQGKEISIMREAARKEVERLGKPHKYLDGSIDKPFLNKDTV